MCNPCSRAPITAARFSRAAFSDPGRFSSRLLPLIPATARDSIARGVTFSPSIHMATGMAGISRSSTARDLCAKNTFPWDVQKTGNREPISDTMRKPSRLSTWSRVMTLPPS